jgi:SAM-dependent methyltransferase
MEVSGYDKNTFLNKINKKNRLFLIPYFSKIKYDNDYEKFSDKAISVLFDYAKSNNDELDLIVEKYCNYYLEYLKLQNDFKKYGKYKYNSYSELDSYLDSEFNKVYIYVLLISYLTTSYRYEMMLHITALLDQYLDENSEIGLEIGFGSGIDLISREKYFKNYDIYDTNEFSQIFFNLGFALKKQFSFNRSLYTFSDRNKYSYVQLIELMEHLENPKSYIDFIYETLKNGGFLIFTAAVNMANIDHIYLFNNILSVRSLIDREKWDIIDEQCFINSIINYSKSKREEIFKNNKVPYIVVFLLRKK